MMFLVFLFSLAAVVSTAAGLYSLGASIWTALFFSYPAGVIVFAVAVKYQFNTWAFWRL